MKVILSPNPYRDHGLKAAQSARQILQDCGVEVSICLPFDLDEMVYRDSGYATTDVLKGIGLR